MLTRKSILILLLLFFFLLEGKTQNNKLDYINLLQSKPGKIYTDSKGTSLGCDGLSECFAFKVVFYSFEYNKDNNEFLIGGTIYVDGTAKDSVKVAGVEILLAQPHKDTLTNIRIIGKTVVDKNTRAEFPHRRGDFHIRFLAKSTDKLYFVQGIYGLLEYNIDKLKWIKQ